MPLGKKERKSACQAGAGSLEGRDLDPYESRFKVQATCSVTSHLGNRPVSREGCGGAAESKGLRRGEKQLLARPAHSQLLLSGFGA